MKRILPFLLLISLFLLILQVNGQIKIGNNPTTIQAGSIMEIEHNPAIPKGLLIPRLNTAEMNAIPVVPACNGMYVYNLDSVCICQYSGSAWFSLCGKGTVGKPNFWDLNGNAGTLDGINFLGTTDNVEMNFRVNNQKAGRIDHVKNNVFLGYQAGNSNTGYSNSLFGYRAGFTNTSGYQNTFIGDSAGYSNPDGYWATAVGANALKSYNSGTYNSNTAVGYSAMLNVITGFDNAAFGTGAMRSGPNATGWNNVSIGNWTMFNNVSGANNCALGYYSLSVNTSGNNNTALGYNALYFNSTGNLNCVVGSQGLYGNTTGNNNIGIGSYTGANNLTGSNNIFIGNNTDVASSNLNNAVAIGNKANVGASNSLVLGGTGVFAVFAGTNTVTPNSRFQVNGSFATTVTQVAIDQNYTITTEDQVITGSPVLLDVVFTLPTATGIKGRFYTIKKLTGGIYKITIACNGAETIDGAVTYTGLNLQWKSVTIVSDGSNWIITGSF